jgi:hypothetical protein
MRDYGKIYTRFWTSTDIASLSVGAKLIAAYLLSSPHTTMIGCFRLPLAYIVDDVGMPSEMVAEGLLELSRNGFITRDEGLSLILIPNFLRWNQIENPNQGKAAAKLVEQIPRNSSVYAELVDILKANGKNFPEGFLKGSLTVLKPGTGTGTGTGAGTKQVQKRPPAAVAAFDLPSWIDREAWNAYEEMRGKIRKPMTPRARTLVLKKLVGFEARGMSSTDSLNQSVVSSWTDVYEPKQQNGARTTGRTGGTVGSFTANKSQQRSDGNMEALASVLSDTADSGTACAYGGDAPSDGEQTNSQGLLDSTCQ